MKTKFIILFVCTLLNVLFFNQINLKLLELNFSWTISKLTPYFFLVILGIIFFILTKGLIKHKIISMSVRILFLVLPFSVGFIFYPIYEGDFSNNSNIPDQKINEYEKIKDGLTVVTIAGCPFCLESIGKLKLIKKRNPKLDIDFIVCTKNMNYVKEYQKVSGKSINVRLAKNADTLAVLVGWTFPTFLEKKKGKLNYQWSNDNFGVRAIDQLESDFK